jgi:hypothetical protein
LYGLNVQKGLPSLRAYADENCEVSDLKEQLGGNIKEGVGLIAK